MIRFKLLLLPFVMLGMVSFAGIAEPSTAGAMIYPSSIIDPSSISEPCGPCCRAQQDLDRAIAQKEAMDRLGAAKEAEMWSKRIRKLQDNVSFACPSSRSPIVFTNAWQMHA